MVELSPTFMQLASSKDTDRLFSMLPYKTLSFSKIEGRHGTYALIDKNENRGTDIRRVRPSIRAQLAADKRKAAPKKAAVKSKNHELEDMRELAKRTLAKIAPLTENEYAELAIFAADEV